MLTHHPVLAEPAAERLITRTDGIYLDGTFGRGGHTRAILRRLGPSARLIALDRDPAAAAAAMAIDDPRFHFVHTRFSQWGSTLAAMGIAQADGVLLDLGVSSPQIDDPARGFSLRADGPLDMRMDPSAGTTAAQWLATVTVDELARVLRDDGEERFAASIAKALVARREAGRPISTTAELAAVVAGAVPGKSRRDPSQHPATRTFQALRIHLNQELAELALALDSTLTSLAAGGRLAVISFHSLEDRAVKQFIERHARPERSADPRVRHLPLRAAELPAPVLNALGRLLPDAAEIAANPRARSAVLRWAERTAAPDGDHADAAARTALRSRRQR